MSGKIQHTGSESLFDLVRDEARANNMDKQGTEARRWFFSLRKRLSSVSRTRLLKDERNINRQSRFTKSIMGRMVMFFYHPKHAKTLPYYDTFPLVIPIGPGKTKGSFLGLNLHYLHPMARAKFLDSLLDLANNKNMTDRTKLRVTYNILQSASKYRYFKPAIKMYLNSHVDSQIVTVKPEDWQIAIFLPTEQFNKASRSKVWSESKRKR